MVAPPALTAGGARPRGPCHARRAAHRTRLPMVVAIKESSSGHTPEVIATCSEVRGLEGRCDPARSGVTTSDLARPDCIYSVAGWFFGRRRVQGRVGQRCGVDAPRRPTLGAGRPLTRGHA